MPSGHSIVRSATHFAGQGSHWEPSLCSCFALSGVARRFRRLEMRVRVLKRLRARLSARRLRARLSARRSRRLSVRVPIQPGPIDWEEQALCAGIVRFAQSLKPYGDASLCELMQLPFRVSGSADHLQATRSAPGPLGFLSQPIASTAMTV